MMSKGVSFGIGQVTARQAISPQTAMPSAPLIKTTNGEQWASYDNGHTWVKLSNLYNQPWANTSTTSLPATYTLGPSLIDQIKALEARIAHLEARVPHEPPPDDTPTVEQARFAAEALRKA